MATPNRPTQQDNFRKIIQAIPQFLSNVVTILLASTSFTPTTLVEFFQNQISLLDDATKAKALLAQKVAAIKANKATGGAIVKAFNDFVLGAFSNQPATLAAFAVTPRKVTPKTSNIKALAAAKLVATRSARNTMGRRQRQDVKGTVSDAVTAVLDPTHSPAPKAPVAGAAPVPAPAPAPAPSPAPVTPAVTSPQPASPAGSTPHA
jgi:hypothetical protein